jgi:hypothetical protein
MSVTNSASYAKRSGICVKDPVKHLMPMLKESNKASITRRKSEELLQRIQVPARRTPFGQP